VTSALVEFKLTTYPLPDTECSVVPQSVFVIDSVLTYLWLFWECATPSHVHPTSRYYVIARDQFYQAFPYALVMQMTKRWGEKGLGTRIEFNFVDTIDSCFLSFLESVAVPFMP